MADVDAHALSGIFNSFTRAIFTQRKITSSMAISAACGQARTTGDDSGVERATAAARPLAGLTHRRRPRNLYFQAEILVADLRARERRPGKIGNDVVARGAMTDGAAQAAGFENREHQFFGGSTGIGSGLSTISWPRQVGLNGAGGLFDIGRSGCATAGRGRGDADDDGVHFLSIFGEIQWWPRNSWRRRTFALYRRGCGQCLALATIEFALTGIRVKTDHALAASAKRKPIGADRRSRTAHDTDFQTRLWK